jgi:4-diphosphocytidyl-2-C-methyl-D-erythritol kinase
MSVRVFAPAKINLTLEVGRPRADGLHPLQSVVMFADVGDWIEAAPAPVLSLTIDGPFASGLAADQSNLVLRAARALAAAATMGEIGAAIRLSKHLPIASGIGGGSSDAAAALKALNALWDIRFSDARLSEIARTLGADVPVCVFARSAYMTGAGEAFTPIAAPDLCAVLVNPGVELPTPAVYARFDSMQLGGAFAARAAPSWRTPDDAIAEIAARGNHLHAPARALAPVLDDVAARLQAGAGVRSVAMSGSGATMFALMQDRQSAASLAEALRRERPHWWVQSAQLAGA